MKKRCKHCKIVNEHSRYYCSHFNFEEISESEPKIVDDVYCANCWEIVKNALTNTSARVEKEFVKTNEIDIEVINNWHQRNEASANALIAQGKFALPGLRRIGIGLIDMKTKPWAFQHVEYIYGKDCHSGKEYQYSWWGDDKESLEISVAMEKDLTTGEILGYWL